MVIDMNDEQLLTLAQLQAFFDGTVAVDFSVAPAERYDFIARMVRRFGYAHLNHLGSTSLRSSQRLGTSSGPRKVDPVIFAPG